MPIIVQDAILQPQGIEGEGVLSPQQLVTEPTTQLPTAALAMEVQKLSPSALIDLYVLDATALGGDMFHFHAGTNQLESDVVWQGVTYVRYPVLASGFELSGQGQMPRPKIVVSNYQYIVGAMAIELDDLIMAKVVRKRTHARFLDAVNFPGGVNPNADPSMEYRQEIWYVNRKSREDDTFIEFELASPMDVDGVFIPARQITTNICVWEYRGGDGCPYAGPPVADINDNPTSDATLDRCSKRKLGCQLRFGFNAPLPQGVFPAAGQFR